MKGASEITYFLATNPPPEATPATETAAVHEPPAGDVE